MNQVASKPAAGPTIVERKSDRELVVTRAFDAPANLVFDAWTKPELFKRWWAPKSLGMLLRSCEMDVRTGGTYRLEFGADAGNSMAFFGKYLEVIPNAKIVWTNDEGDEAGAVTTVTFEEQGGQTLLTMSELYPSAEAFEAGHGAEDALPEQFEQLDELLQSLDAGVGSSG
jgi:uncharacterized protein YndB with AHSA1/START domain